jgi:hypothetical protein
MWGLGKIRPAPLLSGGSNLAVTSRVTHIILFNGCDV